MFKMILKLITLCLFLSFSVACTQIDDPKLAFEKGDYERSFELWKPLAEQGDLDAQNYLGIHYLIGLGVKKDHQKAVKWYKSAAQAGHAQAQRHFGDMFFNGTGVQQNYVTAFMWYFAAHQQGNKSAKIRLDVLSIGQDVTFNQQVYAKLEANKYIKDSNKHFQK